MALTLGDNFSYQGAKPLDARLKYATLAEMKAVADATMYDGCMAYCVATDKTYQWKSTNSVDADTGKWREFSSGGGGGASSLSELEDTTISEPSNGQVLEFNSSTNKWENKNPSGSEDAKAYHTDDTAETTIADTDYFPFYDTSATAKRKSLWSNIKSVLKTYFDTLYSTVTESKAQASSGTALSLVTTGEKYDLNTGSSWYGTCSTSASTTAKAVTLSRGIFNLIAGARIAVKFTYTNTASAPTLKIGSNTAKNIKYIDESGTVTTPSVWWNANEVVDFVYDGTQFIMMPTYTMALTPKGNKIQPSEIFATSEKIVGKWTDGRPLYQKTISCGALPNATTKNVTHSISNLSKVVSISGYASNGTYRVPLPYVDETGTKNVSITISSTNIVMISAVNVSAYTESYVTIQYTKTTDSTSSYNLANPTDYSTSEKVVGTWIDGSKLYQKTIAITLPTVITSGITVNNYFAIGASVKNCVSVCGWFNYEGRMLSFNEVNGSPDNTYFARCIVFTNSYATSADRNKIRVQSTNTEWNGCTGYVTIQYTKT